MSYTPTFFLRRFLPFLFVLFGSAAFFSSCTNDEEDETETKTSNQITAGLPVLMDRKGSLADSAEWPRTKAKDAELRMRIQQNPDDLKARLQLAAIFITEARITGEHPYYYPAILTMLDAVLTRDPNNFEATVYKASVKMSQHQFAEGRDLALKARDLNPANAYAYGMLVDANVELGNYQEAVRMSDSMQKLKPSLESYSRASYLREIYGDYPGAIQGMQMAANAGLPGSEPESWSRTTLGYLYEKTGRLDEAEGEYNTILKIRPSYAFALRGMARIKAARRDTAAALSLLDKAAGIMPEFSFYEDKADLLAASGKSQEAQKLYGDVSRMLDEDAASGHTVNLEKARLFVRMGALDSAQFYAAKEYAVRPENIDVNAAMAWIAFQKNEYPKAAQYMKIALRTGIKDPEVLYRASKIAEATGNTAQSAHYLAEAKKVNPSFSTVFYN
ncbi:MAG: tetratricopeptide repeat protein [Sphingobacteriales bacterium]|nr:MAG: tetratricopeptide repeat protein [Sphingobacteriales bacterium]